MFRFFLVCRWAAFGLFIIYNAILCTFAVWNRSLIEDGMSEAVDVYLICIAVLGLVFIFPIMFISLLRPASLANRALFEVIWIAFFAVLQLSGAIAATVKLPPVMCDGPTDLAIPNLCLSTRTVLAFSWLLTTLLISYGFLLVYLEMSQRQKEGQSFGQILRRLWCFPRPFSGQGSPTSMTTTRLLNKPSLNLKIKIPSVPRLSEVRGKPPSILAPKPKQATQIATPVFLERGGMSSQYQIEHYPEPKDLPPMPPVTILSKRPEAAAPPRTFPSASLYTPSVRSMVTSAPIPDPPSPPLTRDWPPPSPKESKRSSISRSRRQTTSPPTSPLSPLPAPEWPPPAPSSPRESARSLGKKRALSPLPASPEQEPPEEYPALKAGTSPPRPRPSGPRARMSSSASLAKYHIGLADSATYRFSGDRP